MTRFTDSPYEPMMTRRPEGGKAASRPPSLSPGHPCYGCGNYWWAAKKKQPTKAVVTALLKDGRARITGCYSEKTGKTYDATVVLEDDGQYANFKLEFDQQKGGKR